MKARGPRLRIARAPLTRTADLTLGQGAQEVKVVGRVVGCASVSADAANYRDTADRWLISGTSEVPIYLTDREELIGHSDGGG